MGLGAGRGTTFEIVGKGSVRLETVVDGEKKRVILEDVLHTPDLRSNLRVLHG